MLPVSLPLLSGSTGPRERVWLFSTANGNVPPGAPLKFASSRYGGRSCRRGGQPVVHSGSFHVTVASSCVTVMLFTRAPFTRKPTSMPPTSLPSSRNAV